MKRIVALAILLASLGTLCLAFQQKEEAQGIEIPQAYAAPRAVGTPVVDGLLTDACWAKAPWSRDFVDIEGRKRPKPAHRTQIKMVWDEKALYIAARLEEPHLQGTLKEHDSYIFHADNDFEVFMDPDGDCHHYGELELNALGTTWDLLLTRPYRDGGAALDSWEIKGLQVKTHLEGTLNNPGDVDQAWTVEIAIPWKTFREIGGGAPPALGDRWRINFSRVEWEWDEAALKNGNYVKKAGKPEANWVWSPQGEINMHLAERWGSVVFVGPEDGSTPPPADDTVLPRLWLGRHHANRLNPKKDVPADFNPITLPRSWFFESSQKASAGPQTATWTTLRHQDGRSLSIDQSGRITSAKKPEN